ncbi:MAG: PqqD family protein [Oscillospiraceae bacterium]|nr:PqqD family protein [Oscillospiraceae bacterium]
MIRDEIISLEKFRPCRISESFHDDGNEIELGEATYDFFRLKGAGRLIWLMLDGKHEIGTIVENICNELSICDYEGMLLDVIQLLQRLEKRKMIVANWDALYKLSLNQELSV